MALLRIADSGAEIRPVELLVDDAGVPARLSAAWAGSWDLNSVNRETLYTAAYLLGFDGAAFARVRLASTFIDIPSVAVVAGTPATVWTPASGKKFRLMGWALSLSVAGSIIFKWGAANTIIIRTPALAAAGVHSFDQLGNGAMPGAANDALKVDVTANGNVAGFVFGTEE